MGRKTIEKATRPAVDGYGRKSSGSPRPKSRGGISETKRYSVLDLFSGVGGMSYGFAARSCFEIVGAIDAEQGKPTLGNLDCNLTYEANIGVRPDSLDLTEYSPTEYRRIMDVRHGRPFSLDVLIACAPCTGFSQVLPKNRKRDHPKNSLVERCALWVEEFRPQVFVMENLPEMVGGKFKRHFAALGRCCFASWLPGGMRESSPGRRRTS